MRINPISNYGFSGVWREAPVKQARPQTVAGMELDNIYLQTWFSLQQNYLMPIAARKHASTFSILSLLRIWTIFLTVSFFTLRTFSARIRESWKLTIAWVLRSSRLCLELIGITIISDECLFAELLLTTTKGCLSVDK